MCTTQALTSALAISVNIANALSAPPLVLEEDTMAMYPSRTLYSNMAWWVLGLISFNNLSAVKTAIFSASCFSDAETVSISDLKVSEPTYQQIHTFLNTCVHTYKQYMA